MLVKLNGVFISRMIYRHIAATVGNLTLHILTDFPTTFQNCPPGSVFHISCIDHSPLPPVCTNHWFPGDKRNHCLYHCPRL